MRPWAQSRGLLSCSCSFWESRASLYKMYLLIFDCAGSCGCTWPFSSCGVELPIAAASFLVEHSLWAWGLQPLVYGLSCFGVEGLTSLTRDRTHAPCIGRQILNHRTTREILGSLSVWFADGNIYGFFVRIFNIWLFKNHWDDECLCFRHYLETIIGELKRKKSDRSLWMCDPVLRWNGPGIQKHVLSSGVYMFFYRCWNKPPQTWCLKNHTNWFSLCSGGQKFQIQGAGETALLLKAPCIL